MKFIVVIDELQKNVITTYVETLGIEGVFLGLH